jgi:hypothetical protein
MSGGVVHAHGSMVKEALLTGNGFVRVHRHGKRGCLRSDLGSGRGVLRSQAGKPLVFLDELLGEPTALRRIGGP